MSTPRSDELLFAAGGDVWEKYGTFVKRTLPEEERGSFSRSSDATYTDRSGNLRTAESGVLRPHYISSESSYSARLEAARTNSITRSEEFDHGDWATVGTPVITADDAVAPDGTTTADKVEDDDGSGFEGLEQSVSVSDDSLSRAHSLFVKKQVNGPVLQWLMWYDGGTDLNYRLFVDPDDGSLSAEEDLSGGTQGVDYGIEDYNSDWWRVWAVGANNGTGNTTINERIFPAIRSAGSVSGSNDSSVTGHQHIWGAQLEGASGGASFPSSYIATTGSAVSRAADDLPFPISWGPQEMTLYVKVRTRGFGIMGDDQRVVSVGLDGSVDTPRLNIWSPGSNRQIRGEWVDDSGNATRPSSSTNVLSYDTILEARLSVAANGTVTLGWATGGGSESTASASGGEPTGSWPAQVIYIGRLTTGSDQWAFADHISGPIIAPGVRTMDEMRSIEV